MFEVSSLREQTSPVESHEQRSRIASQQQGDPKALDGWFVGIIECDADEFLPPPVVRAALSSIAPRVYVGVARPNAAGRNEVVVSIDADADEDEVRSRLVSICESLNLARTFDHTVDSEELEFIATLLVNQTAGRATLMRLRQRLEHYVKSHTPLLVKRPYWEPKSQEKADEIALDDALGKLSFVFKALRSLADHKSDSDNS